MTGATEVEAILWQPGRLSLLDQTRLPGEEVWIETTDHAEVVRAIREMRVRGAPAIGVAAAYAMALAAIALESSPPPVFHASLHRAAADIASARPTAVNLGWAVEHCMEAAASAASPIDAANRIASLATRLHAEDVASNRALGRHGAPLLRDGVGVLTHCNTGSLATAGYGTALGVIRTAWEEGKRFPVFATETRPWLQGARLTMWEFARLGIAATLIVDSAAASLIRGGEIGAVVVGADRIAANGDVANKIGTYALALAAAAHEVPFYVAAPTSTIDLATADGDIIPIEERPGAEVTTFAGQAVAPLGANVRNPAFDVTPAALISAIATERGVARAPLGEALRRLATFSAVATP